MKKASIIFLVVLFFSFRTKEEKSAWIRINQLGYTTKGVKQAVWCSKETKTVQKFYLLD